MKDFPELLEIRAGRQRRSQQLVCSRAGDETREEFGREAEEVKICFSGLSSLRVHRECLLDLGSGIM